MSVVEPAGFEPATSVVFIGGHHQCSVRLSYGPLVLPALAVVGLAAIGLVDEVEVIVFVGVGADGVGDAAEGVLEDLVGPLQLVAKGEFLAP